jgi:hypothetical protein
MLIYLSEIYDINILSGSHKCRKTSRKLISTHICMAKKNHVISGKSRFISFNKHSLITPIEFRIHDDKKLQVPYQNLLISNSQGLRAGKIL